MTRVTSHLQQSAPQSCWPASVATVADLDAAGIDCGTAGTADDTCVKSEPNGDGTRDAVVVRMDEPGLLPLLGGGA
eukprot:7293506-Alexandrium_andersonii.AAC.1